VNVSIITSTVGKEGKGRTDGNTGMVNLWEILAHSVLDPCLCDLQHCLRLQHSSSLSPISSPLPLSPFLSPFPSFTTVRTGQLVVPFESFPLFLFLSLSLSLSFLFLPSLLRPSFSFLFRPPSCPKAPSLLPPEVVIRVRSVLDKHILLGYLHTSLPYPFVLRLRTSVHLPVHLSVNSVD